MAKVKAPARQANKRPGFFEQFNPFSSIPEKYYPFLALGIIVLLFLVFLNPLFFGGKTFQSGDIFASESAKPYIEKAREGFSLWNPHIFLGMPAYALGVEYTWFNLIYVGLTAVRGAFTAPFASDYVKWAFYLIVLAFTMYTFMYRLSNKNFLVSLFSGLAVSFSTGIIVFLYIGHVTKLTSLCMVPLLFLLLLRMQEKIRLLDFFLLVITVQLMVQGFHVQVIFYIAATTGIYFLYYILHSILKKNNALMMQLFKSAGLTVAAVLIAVAIQADNLSQIYEYTPYSTRGTKGINELTSGESEKSASDYYAYHTGWSFSPGEVMTFVVPSWYGFGNMEYNGPLTQNRPVEVNTYFGQMDFVDVAMYMGVLVFFLAMYASIARWKEPLIRFLTISVLFFLLLSFGKNFPVVFDLMFYYFPSFDKFRVPSMALVMVQMLMPVLAGLGLTKIISLRTEGTQKEISILRTIALVFTGLLLISVLASSGLKSWFTERVIASKAGEQLKPIADFASDVFFSDLLFALLFTTALAWSAFMTAAKKFSGETLVLIAILFTVIDLWRIDSRGAKYIEQQDTKELFSQPKYVSEIKKLNDKDPYRVLNIKKEGMGSIQNNSNFNAYFLLEDMHGYSAIKPRAYQDVMDVVGPTNPTFWRMVGVKYLVTDQEYMIPGFTKVYADPKEVLYLNERALPRVYFVKRTEKKTSIEVLNAIRDNLFDAGDVAYIQDEDVKTDVADSTVKATITKYAEAHLIAQTETSGNNFLVFSSTYMPKGWKATVDGQPTKIYRVNHAIMGIVIPKGKHTVEFRYAPDSFTMAKYASLVLSSLVLLGLLAGLFLEMKRRKAEAKTE